MTDKSEVSELEHLIKNTKVAFLTDRSVVTRFEFDLIFTLISKPSCLAGVFHLLSFAFRSLFAAAGEKR